MKERQIIGISDYFQLAILDLSRIVPVRMEHSGRYWEYFIREEVEPILTNYEAGTLQVVARDYAASLQRVKNRIFENERQVHRSRQNRQ